MIEPARPPGDHADLTELMALTAPQVWQALRSQSVFVSGGTGFVGGWLVRALVHADRELGLGLRLTVLSRDPGRFLAANPQLAGPSLRMLAADITRFSFPDGEFRYAVHAALPVADEATGVLAGVARLGAERMAQFARQANTSRLLHVSSGAVYGAVAGQLGAIGEETTWDTTTPPNDYTAAKRAEEQVLASLLPGRVITARCFAFLGPGLLPATGTAAAQFIDSAAQGMPVVLRGDGTPVRSYQYASEMARWLLTLLTLGTPGRAFNVGGAQPLSLGELAQRIHQVAGIAASPVFGEAPAPGRAASIYVPCLDRAARELGLVNTVTLADGIARALHAARNRGSNMAAP